MCLEDIMSFSFTYSPIDNNGVVRHQVTRTLNTYNDINELIDDYVINRVVIFTHDFDTKISIRKKIGLSWNQFRMLRRSDAWYNAIDDYVYPNNQKRNWNKEKLKHPRLFKTKSLQ